MYRLAYALRRGIARRLELRARNWAWELWAYHLVARNYESAGRVAISVGRPQVARQAAVLELRLLVDVVIVVVLVGVQLGAVLAAAGDLVAASSFARRRSRVVFGLLSRHVGGMSCGGRAGDLQSSGAEWGMKLRGHDALVDEPHAQ